MENDRTVLKSEELEVILRLPECYSRSRYDHSGMVEQVRLGKNSFLSGEKIGGGDGLGGIGLAFCLEWNDTAIYDRTAVADYFPLPGVGLLRKADTTAFQFTRDYAVVPFEHIVKIQPDSAEIHSLPHLCQDTAFEQVEQLLDEAWEYLNSPRQPRDGNYAYILRKCAPSFDYFQRPEAAQALREVAKEIYGK